VSLTKPTFWEKVKIILGEIVASFKAVAVAVLVGVSCVGCFNICGHYLDERTYPPYDATKGMACGIVEAFVEKPEWHWGSAGEAGMAHAYAFLFLPVWVVGLPLEAVADTVTFPYDAWKEGR